MFLLHVEEFYMRILGTIHPFGLNDNSNPMKIDLTNFDFELLLNVHNIPFFMFESKRRERSHGKRKRTIVNVKSDPQDTGAIIDRIYVLH